MQTQTQMEEPKKQVIEGVKDLHVFENKKNLSINCTGCPVFLSFALEHLLKSNKSAILRSMCMPTSIQDAKKEFHNAAQQRSISIDTSMVIVHFRYIFKRKILEKVIKPISNRDAIKL